MGWWRRGVSSWPEAYEPALLKGYVAWLAVTLVLYSACRAFGRLKRRSRHPLWSYL